MEVAAASLGCVSKIGRIESVCPVDTHQSNHWQEDTYADSGRTFQLERIEVFDVLPCVTSFCEDQSIYCGEWRNVTARYKAAWEVEIAKNELEQARREALRKERLEQEAGRSILDPTIGRGRRHS